MDTTATSELPVTEPTQKMLAHFLEIPEKDIILIPSKEKILIFAPSAAHIHLKGKLVANYGTETVEKTIIIFSDKI